MEVAVIASMFWPACHDSLLGAKENDSVNAKKP